MLASEPRSIWRSRAASDRDGSTDLIDVEGHRWSYEELLAHAPHPEPDEELWVAGHQQARNSLKRLCAELAELELDLAVVIGDDQLEMFERTNLPALGLYCGERVALDPLEEMPVALRDAFVDLGNDGSVRDGDPDAARRVARSLADQGFDITVVTEPGPRRAIGHAYGAIAKQLVPAPTVRLLPLFINTYYDPNQPTPMRCYELGAALRRAVEALDGNRRVGLIASGGLSHFIVNESFDRDLLSAIRDGHHEYLQNLVGANLQSGTSEVRNWICAAGAIGDLEYRWSDYVAGIRTAAGTGTGLAFALWSDAGDDT